MSVFTTVTRRPVTVLILFAVLLVFSVVIAVDIPIDLQPNVEFSTVTVTTNYPGAGAELVEDTVTDLLENVINSIDNIESIKSTSREGSSTISIEFKYKSGLEKNIDNLRNAIDLVENFLPDGAEKPTIFRFGATGTPVLFMSINANRSQNEIREYVDDVLNPYLEQINGVALYRVSGGVNKTVSVDISLNRLNAYNLTLGEVRGSIQSNGYGGPIGTIETSYKNVGVVFEGKYEDIESIRNIIVAEQAVDNNGNTSFVRLQDLAEVTFGYGKEARQNYLNDKPAVGVTFFKQNDANIVNVANSIKNEIKRLESVSPDDFEFKVVGDFSNFIAQILNTVTNTALYGGLLALLVLIFFLRNTASVICIALSLPISIVLTIMCMNFYGLTLNFMTLAGLTMGVGIIVDNSIVVLENIYKKRKNKVALLPAAEYGTAEMAVPVFASTATTILVFLPMLIFEKDLETIGAYFTNLGFAVVVSVVISYFTAILLVPVLTSKFIPLHVSKGTGIIGKGSALIDSFLVFIENSYKKTLSYIIRRRKRFILLIIVLALLPFLFVTRLGISFLPGFAQNDLGVQIEFPTGTTNEAMYSRTKEFEADIIELLPEIADTTITVLGSGSSISFFDVGLYSVEMNIFLKEYVKPDDYKEIINSVNEITKNYTEKFDVGAVFGGGPEFGGGFVLKVRSRDLNKLKLASESFTQSLKSISKLNFVKSNLPRSDLALSLTVDRKRANASGLGVVGISNELELAIKETRVATFTQGAKEYDINMRLREQDRGETNVFDRLYVRTPRARIPISNLVTRSLSSSEQTILREDSIKTIEISAQLVAGYSITDAITDVRAVLSENPLSVDEEITYYFAGEFEELNKTYRTIGIIFIFAIIFVFGIMASQFESLSDPFIIIFTIPLTFSGVILIYLFTQTAFSSFSLAGIVILVGISVNHGIVLVDYMNILRKRGYKLLEAVAEGARNRFRPILMTTLTTLGGMIPLAFTAQAGAEIIQPLALTLVGGLFTSALLSLFFIPAIFVAFHSTWDKLTSRKRNRLSALKIKHEEDVLRKNQIT